MRHLGDLASFHTRIIIPLDRLEQLLLLLSPVVLLALPALSCSMILTATLMTFALCSSQDLTWDTPSHSGLMSQFIQMKMAYKLASTYGRSLNIVESTSKHHENGLILNMCLIFDLPKSISCRSKELNEKIMSATQKNNEKHLSKKLLGSNETHLFYNNTLPLCGAKDLRDAFVRAVNIPFPLKFSTNYEPLISQLKQVLNWRNQPYTVVHWHRIDSGNKIGRDHTNKRRFLSRCTGDGKNDEVNCISASELIELVRMNTKNEFVYVSTNEEYNSMEISRLREAGFKTFPHSSMGKLTSLEVFILEVSLMLDAETFLTWGVSEIDDEVDHERRGRAMPHCIAKNIVREAVLDATWCGREAQGSNPAYSATGCDDDDDTNGDVAEGEQVLIAQMSEAPDPDKVLRDPVVMFAFLMFACMICVLGQCFHGGGGVGANGGCNSAHVFAMVMATSGSAAPRGSRGGRGRRDYTAMLSHAQRLWAEAYGDIGKELRPLAPAPFPADASPITGASTSLDGQSQAQCPAEGNGLRVLGLIEKKKLRWLDSTGENLTHVRIFVEHDEMACALEMEADERQ